MADSYNKFEVASEDITSGVHQFQAAGHTLKAFLSNDTPVAATDAVKADLSEITAENGYTAGGVDVQNDISRSGGTTTVSGVDPAWTASGGTIGPFERVVLYNDTPTSPADPLIGWWTRAAGALTLQAGETFTFEIGGGSGTLFTLA